VVASAVAVCLQATSAAAQEAPPRDDVDAPKAGAWDHTERPFLYTPDPSVVPAAHVIASTGAGYANVDRGAERPFAADVAHGGAVFDAGAEVGVLRVLSLEGQVLIAGGGEQGASKVAAGTVVGADVRPLPERWPVQATVSGGYLRELGGDNGAWGRVVVAGSIGRLRIAGSGFAEHVFASDRDPIDLMITAGASVALTTWARLGAEYVVQDLEGIWDPDEQDGGVKHFVAATAELKLATRVRLLGGPAVGLSQGAPSILGRVQASYLF
jgi:hypothetical protein